ncbi:MAG: DUF1326 domain-containing protein [Acidobacteria bacterium]|nr:DUF1326 domain-containing protein [Acidobacteriota bacterium]MBV9145347.1 DUF1326 domain-containing protein [Acidobacteriota bacterium]MBV9436239.1 DUF1326 domain-containing protein [Acidobacteriota bacterium]
MRITLKVLLVTLFFSLFSLVSQAQQISGDYLESRSADVYVAQCFANSEVNLTGDQALMAWHVHSGSWNGQKLDGLSVIAAVKANATLGDPYASPYPAKAVLLVDQDATSEQRDALVAFARHEAGKLVATIVKVIPTNIDMRVRWDADHHGQALLRAGTFAAIQTRAINEGDHSCGAEVTYYPPLTKLEHSMAAVAMTDEYDGPGLGVDWDRHGKRSAFVGSFAE